MIRSLICFAIPTFSRSSTVANSPSAKKRAIQAEKRRSHKNKAARHKSRLNGHIKALGEAAAA